MAQLARFPVDNCRFSTIEPRDILVRQLGDVPPYFERCLLVLTRNKLGWYKSPLASYWLPSSAEFETLDISRLLAVEVTNRPCKLIRLFFLSDNDIQAVMEFSVD